MTRRRSQVDFLQGTLDVLILRTLSAGPSHGHEIAKSIRRRSEDILTVEAGSLYPALHRLEAQGWAKASWALSDKGKRARYYELTPAGRKANSQDNRVRWLRRNRWIRCLSGAGGRERDCGKGERQNDSTSLEPNAHCDVPPLR